MGDTSDPTHDVFLLQWRHPWTVDIYTGASVAGAFPTMSAMTARARVNYTVSDIALSSSARFPELAFTFFLMQVSAAQGNAVAVLKKLKVERR